MTASSWGFLAGISSAQDSMVCSFVLRATARLLRWRCGVESSIGGHGGITGMEDQVE